MYSVLYTDQKTKKDKRWHDGTLELSSGYAVLKDANGVTIHRQLCKSIEADMEMGPFLVQNEGQATNESLKRSTRNFLIQYSTVNNATKKEGRAEYDGKSLVVFKDKLGRQICKKICPGISEGENLVVSSFIIDILEAVETGGSSSTGANPRRTLVSKSASAAAAYTLPKDSANSRPANSDVVDKTVKCIYTEDKQKKQKKWVDGVVKLTGTLITIENEETGETVHKRQFSNPAVLVDGYEFDGGKYRFQVTEPTIPQAVEKPLLRKRLLSVNDTRARKDHAINDRCHGHDDNEENLLPNISSSKRTKNTDTLLNMFDDYD